MVFSGRGLRIPFRGKREVSIGAFPGRGNGEIVHCLDVAALRHAGVSGLRPAENPWRRRRRARRAPQAGIERAPSRRLPQARTSARPRSSSARARRHARVLGYSGARRRIRRMRRYWRPLRASRGGQARPPRHGERSTHGRCAGRACVRRLCNGHADAGEHGRPVASERGKLRLGVISD